MPTPEELTRETIDKLLTSAGWNVQNCDTANLDAARGVKIREFSPGHGFGEADYLLFADWRSASSRLRRNAQLSSLSRFRLKNTAKAYQRLSGSPASFAVLPPIDWNRIPLHKSFRTAGIVKILREEFSKGNDFAQKITYRNGVPSR